jgi:ABC-2 type transport system ATP-binding protein
LRDNGASILISTHLLDTAEKLCDRVAIVARGRKLAQGTLEELRRMQDMEGRSLEDIFLTLTEGDLQHAPPGLPR